MRQAGVFVFSDGGLDASTAICSVEPHDGRPVFTDGPFTETEEHLVGSASSTYRARRRRAPGPVAWPSRSACRRSCIASPGAST
jgi:hypothetical protein